MAKHFSIQNTTFSSVKLLCSNPRVDNRGSFTRMFCKEELDVFLGEKDILQINMSVTKERGTVRGMHFQNPPFAEKKFVRCLRGEIFDVVVDLRHNSPTFLDYYAVILSEDNDKTLYIPEGFAHGFQCLTDNCELLYLHTNMYSPGYEGGININDKKINIPWPLPIKNCSERDLSFPLLEDNYTGIVL